MGWIVLLELPVAHANYPLILIGTNCLPDMDPTAIGADMSKQDLSQRLLIATYPFPFFRFPTTATDHFMSLFCVDRASVQIGKPSPNNRR